MGQDTLLTKKSLLPILILKVKVVNVSNECGVYFVLLESLRELWQHFSEPHIAQTVQHSDTCL